MSAFVLKKSTFSNRWTDMIFVKKFTLPDFPTKIEQWREGQISSLPLKETYSSRKSWRAWDTFSGWPSCNRTCCSKLKSYQFILLHVSKFDVFISKLDVFDVLHPLKGDQVHKLLKELVNLRMTDPHVRMRMLVFQSSKNHLCSEYLTLLSLDHPVTQCHSLQLSPGIIPHLWMEDMVFFNLESINN